jgi:hypothetical protein
LACSSARTDRGRPAVAPRVWVTRPESRTNLGPGCARPDP